MERFGDCVLAVVLIGLTVATVFVLTGMFNDYQSKNDYAYIDMDGNTGFADYCSDDRGSLVCARGEGKIIVKKYAKVEE